MAAEAAAARRLDEVKAVEAEAMMASEDDTEVLVTAVSPAEDGNMPTYGAIRAPGTQKTNKQKSILQFGFLQFGGGGGSHEQLTPQQLYVKDTINTEVSHDTYQVDRILEEGQHGFLISWTGNSSKHDSWVLPEDVSDGLIASFRRRRLDIKRRVEFQLEAIQHARRDISKRRHCTAEYMSNSTS